MNHQALYRRLRPSKFTDMVGQESVVRILRSQVASRTTSHAYLFCGSRGTGKTTAARILARAANCEQPVNGDACGECPTCSSLGMRTDIDIREIDAASNTGVDDIRMLKEEVVYPPQFGRYKVYIIDEVHMLSTNAFNALLKTLEEPPEHAMFILATTDPQKIPATVLSRCQRFEFARFSITQIRGLLVKAANEAGMTVDDEALTIIARAAEGAMRDALGLLDTLGSYGSAVTVQAVRDMLGLSDTVFLFRFFDALLARNASHVIQSINTLILDGKDPVAFLKDLGRHTRALLVAKSVENGLEGLLDITWDAANDYMKQAERFSSERLMRLLEIFQEAEGGIRYASSQRLIVEMACLKACLRHDEADVSALTERVGELEHEVDTLLSMPNSGMQTPAAAPESLQADNTAPEGVSVNPEPFTADIPEDPVLPEEAENVPSDIPSARHIWETAVADLHAQGGLLGIILTETGRFVGVFGKAYRFCLPEGSHMELSRLQNPDNAQKITEALSRAGAADAAFEVVVETAVPDYAKNQQMDQVKKELEETFGRKRVWEV